MRYFTHDEFACRCGCGENKMAREFEELLDSMRHALRFPLVVASGYRCPHHNIAVSTTGATGPHTTGYAVDFRVNGEQAWKLVDAAMNYGCRGIGVNQRGPIEKRFIHLDTLSGDKFPRPRFWSY